MKEVDVVAIADIQIQWHLFTRVCWNILHQIPCANERGVGSSCCSKCQGHIWASDAGPIRDSDCEQDDRGYQGTRGLCFFLRIIVLVRTTSQEWLGSRVIFLFWATSLALRYSFGFALRCQWISKPPLGLGPGSVNHWIQVNSKRDEVRSCRSSKGFQIAFRFRD